MAKSNNEASSQTPKPHLGELKTVIEIAKLIGKNPRYVRDLIDMGAPIYQQGRSPKPHIIDFGAFWDFQSDRNRVKQGRPPNQVNENDPKVRANAAVAEMKELDLAQRRGELIPIAQLEAFLKDVFSEFRSNVLADTEPAEIRGMERHLTRVADRFRQAVEGSLVE